MSAPCRNAALALAVALLPLLQAQAAGVAAPPPPDLLSPGTPSVPAARASAPRAPASAAPDTAVRSVHMAPTPAQPASGAVMPSAAPQTTVVEDRYTRIEEVHERGEIRSIKVQPKGGQPYEILPTDGGRDLSNSHSNSRGAAGQRVWRILTF